MQKMNLYHLSTHKSSPKIVNAVIEIPKGTSAKYEYHKDGYFFYDRSLTSAMVYPANYGFIPNTLADDGDALDVLVYNSTPIDRGTVVECEVIGVLDMEDEDSKGNLNKDYKILCTPTSHIRSYRSIKDIDPLFLKISKNFFLHYKDLNEKQVNVFDWQGKAVAQKVIKNCSNKILINNKTPPDDVYEQMIAQIS